MGVTRRGTTWYVKWKDGAGIWRRRKTAVRTKAQAQVIHAELVRQAERQRMGLEPLPPELSVTLWQLVDWWLKNRCRAASVARARRYLAVHVQRTALGALPLKHVTHNALEAYFERMTADGYAPRSINILRTHIGATFTQASKADRWAAANPVRRTSAREVAKTPRPILSRAEVELVLAKVPPQWRGFFAVAAYLGMRKGEICGLLKADYDRAGRTLYVGRSYTALVTKGRRVDRLPVPSALVPHLEEALHSNGAHLFPGPGGKMRTEHCNPHVILAAALRRAGLTTAWVHKCLRCPRRLKSWREMASPEPVRCERCGAKTLAVAKPRELHFHDLRHTAATHLLQAGVKMQHVQRILRHSTIKTTVDTYGHLDTEDLRAAVEQLGPGPVPSPQLRAVPNPK